MSVLKIWHVNFISIKPNRQIHYPKEVTDHEEDI